MDNKTIHLFPISHPEDWNQSWAAVGGGAIYGWGHNHRGQLGGVEGAKVKVPTGMALNIPSLSLHVDLLIDSLQYAKLCPPCDPFNLLAANKRYLR